MMMVGSWISYMACSSSTDMMRCPAAASRSARALDVHDRLAGGQLAYAFRAFHPPCLQAFGHVDGTPYQYTPAAAGQIGQGGGYGLIGFQ